MSDDLDIGEEYRANLIYREAYGHACALVEARGRHSGHGLEVDALAQYIAGLLHVAPAAIVEAVEDALAGRKPRW